MKCIVVSDNVGGLHLLNSDLCEKFNVNHLCGLSNSITNDSLGSVDGDNVLNYIWEEDLWDVMISSRSQPRSCMSAKGSCAR